jgi:hypothetical protein
MVEKCVLALAVRYIDTIVGSNLGSECIGTIALTYTHRIVFGYLFSIT